ncbi:MAG: metallophosphoesterase, partial [Proteobacteria bacterium]|nr:metallophosphoesterase [Pseudomonadota bacterium]
MNESPGGRVAVISDIHANLEALSRVLDDIDALGIMEIVSLGDVIGYGPDPQACADILRQRGIPSTLGNHEQGLRPGQCPTDMNPVARDALSRTACMLDEDTAASLRALPRSLERGGCHF